MATCFNHLVVIQKGTCNCDFIVMYINILKMTTLLSKHVVVDLV